MAQYDVYRIGAGLVVDVQTDLVTIPLRRVVIPLVPVDTAAPPTVHLHPRVTIEGADYLLATHLLGAVPDAQLRAPVGTLAAQADQITRALDVLFHGI